MCCHEFVVMSRWFLVVIWASDERHYDVNDCDFAVNQQPCLWNEWQQFTLNQPCCDLLSLIEWMWFTLSQPCDTHQFSLDSKAKSWASPSSWLSFKCFPSQGKWHRRSIEKHWHTTGLGRCQLFQQATSLQLVNIASLAAWRIGEMMTLSLLALEIFWLLARILFMWNNGQTRETNSLCRHCHFVFRHATRNIDLMFFRDVRCSKFSQKWKNPCGSVHASLCRTGY